MSFLKRIKSQMIDPRMGNHRHKDRVLVNSGDLRELVDHFEGLQARIDELMLEYCPSEMTEAQIKNWGKHQAKSEIKI